jgi:hypothetical protein
MGFLREATLSGINETIGTIRSAQNEFVDTQEHFLTLVSFNAIAGHADVRTLINCRPIGEIGEDFRDYHPHGCTPLYDAMGLSLIRLHEKVKGDKEASVVVTVLTDGLENASHEWRVTDLRRLIEQLKEEGWSFSYMGSAHDVKSVSDLLAIDNYVEFSHDIVGTRSSWGYEHSSRHTLYQKLHMMTTSEPNLTDEEILAHKRQFAREYHGPRVTPERVLKLSPNEIFVFGSNASGFHGGGAAAQAMHDFGAIWGQGEGLQGRSYAIPTMEGLESMKAAVERFTQFATQHPELRFLVTRVGCGIAGHTVREVAPLFSGCVSLDNVSLPADFWDALGLKMNVGN